MSRPGMPMRSCATGVRLGALALFIAALAKPTAAATITVVNADGAGVGFNNSTAASPVGGNAGTTRGQQALNAFQYAADLLGSLIYSDVEIVVEARFAPSPALDCGSDWAVLGGANPAWVCSAQVVHDHPAMELWYPGALCNRFAGTADPDIDVDISADFNGNIGQGGCLPGGGWYFGLDATAPANLSDLVTVVLHELSHGLGFLSLADSTGAAFAGAPDAFMVYTYDATLGKFWYQMSDAERGASGLNTLNVTWRGPRTVQAVDALLTAGADPASHPYLYTPSSYETGSSVSHFATQASPNLLMEPIINDDLDHASNDIDVTLQALQDIGWRDPGCNNGLWEGAEECDDGVFNDDDAADACRTSCELPSCGDGTTDTGEECDDGAQNSMQPGQCRPGCLNFYCGDGIVDTGEQCDDAAANADDPDSCRTDCSNPACGDGILDTGEACDDGAGNGPQPDACRATCVVASCGDGVTDTDEECDDGTQNSMQPGHCRPGCLEFFCGDSIVDTDEECDDGADNADLPDACRSDCRSPICGDGILDGDEECDDGNTTWGDGCSGECTISDALGPEVEPPAVSTGGDAGSMGNGEAGATGNSGNSPGSGSAAANADEGDSKVSTASCSCRTVGNRGSGAFSPWVLLLGLAALRRRRRVRVGAPHLI